MRWFTKSRRNLASREIQPIIKNEVALHVFVKKDDAEGTEFFYLGQAQSANPTQSKMAGEKGAMLDVVYMDLRFDKPIDTALFDYFHPSI